MPISVAPAAPAQADPHGLDPHTPGAKLDAGKLQAGILEDFSLALLEVAKVGTMGANKYSRGGWLRVPNAIMRYTDAFWRHLLAMPREELDPESGLSHHAHRVWNDLAILELKLRAAAALQPPEAPAEATEQSGQSELFRDGLPGFSQGDWLFKRDWGVK